MSKVTMPKPVAYVLVGEDGINEHYTQHVQYEGMLPLITTIQAEAYAIAKVREALEALLSIAWELGVCANDIRAMLPNNTTTEK